MKDQRTGGLGGTRKRQRYAAATNRLKICVSTYCRTLDIFLPWTTLKKACHVFYISGFLFFPPSQSLSHSFMSPSSTTLVRRQRQQQQQSTLPPTSPPQASISYQQQQQCMSTPTIITRLLPNTSYFTLYSYSPARRRHVQLIVQNYCLLHKIHYATSWCPSCPVQF